MEATWGREMRQCQEMLSGHRGSPTLGFSAVRRHHEYGLEMGLGGTSGRKAELTSNSKRSHIL